MPVAPDNVGPKTMPDYARLSGQAVRGLPGGGKTFVGPADDPFFVDLGSIFDGINIDKPGRPAIGLGNQGGGKDDVSGFNVHSFVLQVPQSEVTRDRRAVSGPKASNAVVGIWTTTERKAIKVKRGKAKSTGCRSAASATRSSTRSSSRSARRTSTTRRRPRTT